LISSSHKEYNYCFNNQIEKELPKDRIIKLNEHNKWKDWTFEKWMYQEVIKLYKIESYGWQGCEECYFDRKENRKCNKEESQICNAENIIFKKEEPESINIIKGK
jgi:hypothetical protein